MSFFDLCKLLTLGIALCLLLTDRSSTHAQTIRQSPTVQICQLPCSIALQPELALTDPNAKPDIQLQSTACVFGSFDYQTRSTQCTATVTLQTNIGVRLHWTLAPITHATSAAYQLQTEYTIEPSNRDAPLSLTLEPKTGTRNASTPVWLPGVHGQVATYTIKATASLATKDGMPKAGRYIATINVAIEPIAGAH